MPKSKVRYILTAIAIGFIAVFAYYVGTVWRARIRTPGIVRSVLGSDRIKMRGSDLSSWQRCALLTVQDPDFYKHSGVKRPFWNAFTNTSVTQAVVKQLYFEGGFKPGIGKIRQTLIARYALDPLSSKEDQLTLFANLVWFGKTSEGKSIAGFADASEAYFNKTVSRLSEEQFLALVAMLRGPIYFNLQTHPGENAKRVAGLKSAVIGRCGHQ